ncbi:alcohol dehydrogenase catalytic domain-containing protein [Paeniroseomonas aquatica]|uniref:alcohol dehydrogenase catalytic domain-containing protein n=1 Tax=Paeniroseomonas aquatica TaxID=373043 RepID=UPI0036152070
MRAVWYDRTGPAAAVLQFGERPLPEPAAGEVRVRLAASGVNPADTYRRAGTSYANEWPLIIPNSDGAGVVEALGEGVDAALLGRRVWLYNAQRGRPSAPPPRRPASRSNTSRTCPKASPMRSAPASASPR